MSNPAAIFLHGHLAEKYGERFDLHVASVAEAIRMLQASFGTFLADLAEHKHGFYVRVDGGAAQGIASLREARLSPEIHIVPALAGAGGDNNGVGQILLGAVMIAAAYYGGFSPETTGLLYNIGMNMAISGVSTLLFASSMQTPGELQDSINGVDNATYAFAGPVNTVSQGNPVPILYGHLIIGSQVISAGVNTK